MKEKEEKEKKRKENDFKEKRKKETRRERQARILIDKLIEQIRMAWLEKRRTESAKKDGKREEGRKR